MTATSNNNENIKVVDSAIENSVDTNNATDKTAIEQSKETKRYWNLIKCLTDVCKIAGFRLENRVVVTDLRTGKTWE